TGRYLGGVVGASLAGAVLGVSVTAGGVSIGFGLLAAAALAVAFVSLWLPGRPNRERLDAGEAAEAATSPSPGGDFATPPLREAGPN
ncbi:MAG TPA: hypothetical protein VGQ85_00215, partial [Candidatus Limnocylindrales bacterium]|nr:hypothetical protein [Candidatus Limnocylindrales bacterium]